MFWNVYLHNRIIDTVWYDKDCSSWYVKNGLVNHDGYDPRIQVHRKVK